MGQLTFFRDVHLRYLHLDTLNSLKMNNCMKFLRSEIDFRVANNNWISHLGEYAFSNLEQMLSLILIRSFLAGENQVWETIPLF